MTTTTTTPTPDTTPPATPPATNVNVSSGPPAAGSSSMWTASRVIALGFTVIEVLLLVRFAFKLFGANAEQGIAAAIYGITDPLVAPFRGIFSQPEGTQLVEIASLLAIVFFMLVAALVVAIVRAFTGKQAETSV